MVSIAFPSILLILIAWAAFAIPMISLVGKVKMNKWWTAFLIVPFHRAPVLLWIVAFKRWPKEDTAERFA